MNDKWVFGMRQDLLLFGGSTLLAFIYGYFFPVWEHTLLLYVFADIYHSYSTFFYTMNSKRLTQKYFYWLYGAPVVILLINIGIFYFWGKIPLYRIFAHISLYHFIRQQNAWFFISSAKSGIGSDLEKKSNSMIAWSATWVPQVISMSNGSNLGWFYSGDMIQLPSWVGKIAMAFAAISVVLYLFVEIKKWRKTGVVAWSKHFHIINNAIVWVGARLILFGTYSQSMTPILIMFGHSFPYTYLGYVYILDRKKKGEEWWPVIPNVYVFCGLVLLLSYLGCYIQYTNWTPETGIVLYSAFVATSMYHYLLDSFLWKGKTHPEGAAVFRPQPALEGT